MKPRVLLTLGLLAFAGLLWLGVKTSRAGYEGPDYSVISKEGEVEIRRYETMTAAATPMKIDGKEGGRDSGFGRLFRFITGDNEREENIAMTSPVFIESDTAATEKVMIFVMPEATVEAGTPKPKNASVTVKPVEGGTFAALRFKGYRSEDAKKEALEGLRKAIAAAGLTAEGEPYFAYYDPPWTPEMLRRNEVLWRVSGVKAE